jgi:uncharacterized delta-60 repeat protein
MGSKRLAGIRLALAFVGAVGALALAVAIASAAGGGEKSTFGKDGTASQSLGIHYEETGFSNLSVQSDGGLAVQQGGRLEHYLPDGASDPSRPPTKLTPESKIFPAADGKSFIIQARKLQRFDADGSLDTGFGHAGTVKVPYGVGVVGELGSGKILVVSTEVGGARTLYASVTVSLLNQDGSAAGGFSKSVPPVAFGLGVIEIVSTGDGGALIVSGSFLLEVHADGSANTGFGTEGLVTRASVIVGAHILPDGSIEAVGTVPSMSGQEERLALVRYTAAGQPETAFGVDGVRSFAFDGHDEAKAASWAADGSVIVGGRTQAAGPCPEEECEEAPILAAFDPAGNVQSGFGKAGMLKLEGLAGPPQGYASDGVTALVRRPDGSVVAAGDVPPNRSIAFLAALSPQGMLLRSFGEGGIVRAREPVIAAQKFSGYVPLPGGKLLAAGVSDVGFENQPVLVRYDADGSLDPSFGEGSGYVVVGKANFEAGFAVRGEEALTGLYGFPQSSVVLSQTSDGKPVGSFGAGGTVALPREVRVSALAFANDGDPVVLGIQRGEGVAEPGVVLRFRPDGRPDGSFGRRGRLPLQLPGGGEVAGRDLLAGPGERLLVAGKAGHRFALTSLLPSGRSDPRFGARGWSVIAAGGPAHDVTLSRSGPYIYLAGIVGEKEDQDVVLMRLHRDGRLDTGFGHRGRLVAPVEFSAHPTKILPTRRGVLVVLSGGGRPLLTFAKNGNVRRRRVGNRPEFVEYVQATVSRGHLIFGWNAFSHGIGREISYLARRGLDR